MKHETIPKRLAVNLTSEENRLVIALRAALEKKFNNRLSLSEVVRVALHTQAVKEGLSDPAWDCFWSND